MVEAAIAASLVVSGVATYYPADEFAGRPLYCDQFTDWPLTYSSEDLPPWAAFDIGWYESGRVRCGDLVLLNFDNGEWLLVRAWDAGTFQGYYVNTWPELPILADLPEHLRPDGAMAWQVRVVNLSQKVAKAR